ncbi:hypothetical protein GCM10023231_26750 [Olivibacter ginsenosidimutans]|uniref:DUF2116 family Zn-ribbon domain-containing protein n=1 Tax=Olivibacter ginsenosidimutans TaxID=1176537 RepID=A0ABP9BPC2_9SPHI
MDRFCLDCNTLLIGRADKKFCNDACRSNYNNQQNNQEQYYIRQINSTLKKNRAVMKKLNPNGKTKVLKEDLVKLGFNFNHFTHVLDTAKGSRYYFCYDCGFLYLKNGEILLVKKLFSRT